MNIVLWGGAALVGALVLYQLYMRVNLRKFARYMRWFVGGVTALLTAFLLVRGQIGIASVTGYFAFMILRYGRIGPWSFESYEVGDDNESGVKSRFISMTLDHETGAVEGRVVAGAFKGANLLDIGPDDMRVLLAEVARDPDSLALLETWLDRNRAGWREQYEQGAWTGGAGADAPAQPPAVDADLEAYDILGLKPGASADEIHDAHRKLMKGVHPDQGGSNYLAAKINAAKDRLLKRAKR